MPAHPTQATSRGPITIRAASEADAAALGVLRLEMLETHPVAFSADAEIHRDRPIEFWLDWLRARSDDRIGALFVAEAADGLIGMAGIRAGDGPKTMHGGTIWGVFVRPDWRGLRVADRVIGACLDWARSRDLTVVKLAVVTTAAPAIRCYLRCGFSVYGVEPRAIRHDGAYHDELLMSRVL
jgi:RimJ/RimL family protein N-acetyltransferase